MKQYTILVVDDRPDNLKTITNYIQGAGSQYTVLKAISGKIACKIAEKEIPDLIITDWKMPEIDGIDIIEYLKNKKTTKDIPIIMITGIMTLPQDLKTALEAGAVDYIRKPIVEMELLARIDSLLHLSESYKEIKILNATKDKFFSIIAHDLRNPFNVLLNFSQILYEEYNSLDNEQIKRLIELMYNNSITTFRLLQNLLTWSSLQRNKIGYNPEKIVINNLFIENIDLSELIADEKDIKLRNETTEKISVIADQNMISTVIRNLISNAIKFTPKNGTVTVGCRRKDKITAEIYVSDTGIGISETKMSKLFNIDESSSTLGTDNEMGTGLGLILCKEFLEKNKGKITVQSTEGEGSTFTFTLPTEYID
jgi:signal transduction histidine kinase